MYACMYVYSHICMHACMYIAYTHTCACYILESHLRSAAAPLPLAELSIYNRYARFFHIIVDKLGFSVCIIYMYL